MAASRQRWSPTVPADTEMLPVRWSPEPDPRSRKKPRRPKLGDSDRVRALERARRLRIGAGVLAGLLGVAALLVGLSDKPTHDVFDDLQRALVLQNAGQLDEASEVYRQVIADDPGQSIAHFNLAVIDQTRGDLDLAAAGYERVLRLDPDYVPALYNLAVLRTGEGAIDEAIDLYRRAVDLEPNQAAALLNLGVLLVENGENIEGSELISRAIEINPSLREQSATG